MARDLNKVMLIGRLGADPAMRFTEQGSPKTTFRVASNREWTTPDGQQHADTEWFRIVAWDRLAEVCNDYLAKGTQVYVEGRLQTRKWQDREGQERVTIEVVASEMIILSAKATAPTEEAAQPPPTTRRSRRKPMTAVPEEDLPF